MVKCCFSLCSAHQLQWAWSGVQETVYLWKKCTWSMVQLSFFAQAESLNAFNSFHHSPPTHLPPLFLDSSLIMEDEFWPKGRLLSSQLEWHLNWHLTSHLKSCNHCVEPAKKDAQKCAYENLWRAIPVTFLVVHLCCSLQERSLLYRNVMRVSWSLMGAL